MIHMMQVVVLLHRHVEKMKEIVILTVIAKLVLSVEQIIAHLDSTSLLVLTVVNLYQVFSKSLDIVFYLIWFEMFRKKQFLTAIAYLMAHCQNDPILYDRKWNSCK